MPFPMNFFRVFSCFSLLKKECYEKLHLQDQAIGMIFWFYPACLKGSGFVYLLMMEDE